MDPAVRAEQSEQSLGSSPSFQVVIHSQAQPPEVIFCVVPRAWASGFLPCLSVQFQVTGVLRPGQPAHRRSHTLPRQTLDHKWYRKTSEQGLGINGWSSQTPVLHGGEARARSAQQWMGLPTSSAGE